MTQEEIEYALKEAWNSGYVSAMNNYRTNQESSEKGESYSEWITKYKQLTTLKRWTPVPKEPEHLETHQEALERLQLKVGDKVKVLCKAESFERDWEANWAKVMDDYIGKTIKVIDFSGNSGVRLDCYYNFPAFVLEKVEN